MSARPDLRERVLALVREHGAVSGNRIARALRRRREDVSAVLRACEAAGQVLHTPTGWTAAGNGPETARTLRSGYQGSARDVAGAGEDVLVGGPCGDQLLCAHRWRYPTGPWGCRENHVRVDGSAPVGRTR